MGSSRRSCSRGPSAPSRIDEALAKFELLSDLGGEEIETLARGAVRYEVARRRTLFRQGERCTAIHLVTSGQIKLSIQTPQGQEKVIELVGAGGSLGEVSLIMKQPYRMTAEVIADAGIIELGTDAVLDQVARNANFLRSVLRAVCRRLERRTSDLENCLLLNGKQRVTGFLLSQLPGNGFPVTLSTVTLPAKKSIIASRLNLTQEHFSRILREMQSAGLVAVRGRQIQLLDVDRLRGFPA